MLYSINNNIIIHYSNVHICVLQSAPGRTSAERWTSSV